MRRDDYQLDGDGIDPDSADASLIRLHAAGWSVGQAAMLGPGGRTWLVWGTNGENVIRGEGATPEDAWRLAEDQARALGMLRI